jgi:hypothetical protein
MATPPVGAGERYPWAGGAHGQAGYTAGVLEFIDRIVIPFLNSLYGAVGYVGVMIAMAIESAMIPLPSEGSWSPTRRSSSP